MTNEVLVRVFVEDCFDRYHVVCPLESGVVSWTLRKRPSSSQQETLSELVTDTTRRIEPLFRFGTRFKLEINFQENVSRL